MTFASRRRVTTLTTLALSAALVVPAVATAQDGPTEISMFYHGAGNPEELAVLEGINADFNASQDEYVIAMEAFPQIAYNDAVVGAALAGDLACLVDVDGPVMPDWAWSGYLVPLDIDPATTEDFLPGALGTWDGQLYSVGLWDAAKAIYARQSDLDNYGIRVPTLEEPWTGDEFNEILAMYAADYDYAFDPGMNWTGEWYPYAFSPFLQSFGGDIIDRSTMLTAEGVLNGPEAVAFGEWWQMLFSEGYAPGTSQQAAERDTGFIDGMYGMQWNGNWAGRAAVDALGDDVIFLPAPDFGNGPTIGAGSWQWAVSASCENPEGANAWIEFATQDEYLAAFSDFLGLAPATPGAAEISEFYSEGGPLEVFFGLSNAQALIRPPTPAYTNAALVFEKAMADIANGGDVQTVLDAAVDEIDTDIESNDGYGF